MRPPTAPPDHVNKTRNQVEQQQQQRNPRTSAQLFYGNSPRATRTTHVLSRTKHQRPSSHAASQRCSLIISTPHPLSLYEFAPFSSGAFPSYQKPHQQQKTTCCLTLEPTCCLIPTSNTKPCQTGCTNRHSDIGSSSSTPTPAEGQIPARSDALLSSRLIPQALRQAATGWNHAGGPKRRRRSRNRHPHAWRLAAGGSRRMYTSRQPCWCSSVAEPGAAAAVTISSARSAWSAPVQIRPPATTQGTPHTGRHRQAVWVVSVAQRLRPDRLPM